MNSFFISLDQFKIFYIYIYTYITMTGKMFKEIITFILLIIGIDIIVWERKQLILSTEFQFMLAVNTRLRDYKVKSIFKIKSEIISTYS